MICEIRQVGAAQVKLIIQQMVSLRQQHQLRETRQCLPSKLINPIHKNIKFLHRNGHLPAHSAKKKPILQNNITHEYYMIKQMIKVIQI
jgi:hypothetical protein